MIFWDSSALVALLVTEGESAMRHSQLQADSTLAVWWATSVECESALQRRLREGALTPTDARLARERLTELSMAWHEVNPTPAVRTLALRLLRTHPLRAADALQLAAALALDQAVGTGLRFACADARLLFAAEAEGLACL
jgi:predicted nucleic acid-binding protein